jgi:CNT family concentrative nucleoside transporter
MSLGIPAQNLITASMMSIPASVAISKIRMPELEEPVTRGRVVVDLGDDPKGAPVSALQALSKGAVLGLFVSGQILCNVITILAFVGTINGLLTWIGRGFGIHELTLQLGMRYVFYPLAFLTGTPTLHLLIHIPSLLRVISHPSTGVPRSEIMRVSELLATKLIENEIVAYSELRVMMTSSNPLSKRGFTIASYALCSFANLTSLGIQIGVLSALAPSRTRLVARIGPSAVICGFISTLQAAGIACVSFYSFLSSLWPVGADIFACSLAVACSSDKWHQFDECIVVGLWRLLYGIFSPCSCFLKYMFLTPCLRDPGSSYTLVL